MLGSNLDTEKVCFKIKGGREVRWFISSIFGECTKKTGVREVRFKPKIRRGVSQNQGR